MSPLTTITASCAATTAAALVTLGAVAALGTANAGDTTAPGSHAGVTVVRPAGTMPNGISRTPTEAIPAATAIEYGLIAAVNISVDSPTAAPGRAAGNIAAGASFAGPRDEPFFVDLYVSDSVAVT
jgi:hypothetical protein